jgi:hypothetical protein
MDKDEQIREGLRRIASSVGPAPTLMGKVVSVNEDDQTCVIDDDGLEIPDVRLRPVLNGNRSLVLFPKVGTYGLAVRLEKTEEWMLVGADQVSKIIAETGDIVFTLGEDKVSLTKPASSLYDILKKMIESQMQIIVIEGRGPDIEKLADAQVQLENLMQ